MIINGISYWKKDEKYEMLNLQEGLKTLQIPAFMDKVNGEIIGYCNSVETFIVEEGNPWYYVQDNCLMTRDGELVAGGINSVIPTDGRVKRIGNMAFFRKAPTHLVIPEGVKEIGYRAFAESEALYSVYLPDSVENFSQAFEGCENLETVFFGGSREDWERITQGKRLNPYGVEPQTYCRKEGKGQRQMHIETRHVCPVCGKMMFAEYDSYEICGTCGWEDETWCETHPDEESGPNYCSLNEYRRRFLQRVAENPLYAWKNERLCGETEMTDFEKWSGFIMRLAHFECVTGAELERLKAELSVIQKTGSAELFQSTYNSWQSLYANGFRGYITGDAERWFVFYFLSMTRENPIEKEIPEGVFSKVVFVMERKEQNA